MTRLMNRSVAKEGVSRDSNIEILHIVAIVFLLPTILQFIADLIFLLKPSV